MRYRKIVIWKRPDGTLYYKKINGFYNNYIEGLENGFGHVIVLIIDIEDIFYQYKKPLRNKIIDKIVNFLENKKKRY